MIGRIHGPYKLDDYKGYCSPQSCPVNGVDVTKRLFDIQYKDLNKSIYSSQISVKAYCPDTPKVLNDQEYNKFLSHHDCIGKEIGSSCYSGKGKCVWKQVFEVLGVP